MEPLLMIGGAIAGLAWLRKRNAEHGSAGALASPAVNAQPINPEPNRMAEMGMSGPVSSEMSLGMRPDSFVQRPLQPAAVWNPQGAVSQGSGTPIADDGRAFLPAIPAKTVPVSAVGSVQDWTDLTMTDPAFVSPSTLTPQPSPVTAINIASEPAAPEVAVSGPKWERGVLVFQAEP